jgi:hypothetical protein
MYDLYPISIYFTLHSPFFHGYLLPPSPAISRKGLNSGARSHEAGMNPHLTANPQSRLCRSRARPERVTGKMVIGVMFQNADHVNNSFSMVAIVHFHGFEE